MPKLVSLFQLSDIKLRKEQRDPIKRHRITYQPNLKQSGRIRDPPREKEAICLFDYLYALRDFHWAFWFLRVHIIVAPN